MTIQEQQDRLNTPSRDLLTRAIDGTAFGCDAITELGSLFKAIANTGDPSAETRHLANIGQYLTENWAGLLDCENEELKNKRGGQYNG